ncbi:TIGR00296 family protein [Nitrososphaera sp.]|uniref:TIGR00296 family protein n=1 Tax=Nitrososphaera sp. TaxID=1971748 RepID=UPI0017FD6488|nr:TIGR00296 family protein [Nitrososphaera sp.]NWG36064.1 TIGR00296 family protein [Nitrososphaera sp.]
MVSDAEGQELVRLARLAVQRYLEDSTVMKTGKTGPMSGVFVTLNYLAKNEERLRGCIGFPLAYKALHQSVVEAAIAAATEDPRFPPVDRKELDRIIFEVSVLTEPEEVPGIKGIRIGQDGLILRWKYGSGLLLPQVPVELGWDVDEYLANLCYKAGAPPDALSDPSSRLYRFQAQVFKERSPGGDVTRLEQYK